MKTIKNIEKWNLLSEKIKNLMLDYQEFQTDIRDENVFKNDIMANKHMQGFDWDETKEGYDYWAKILKSDFITKKK